MEETISALPTALLGLASAMWAIAAFFITYTIYRKLAHAFHLDSEEERREEEELERKRRLKEKADRTKGQRLAEKWAKIFEPILPKGLNENLARKIIMAGGLDGITSAQVVLFSVGAAIGGMAFGVLTVLMTGWSPWLVFGTLVIGMGMPFIWLRDQVKRRHMAILSDLPYHLDIITLCVEAGLDFGAAVARMVEKGRPGPLLEEFSALLAEIRIGKTRVEAMTSLSERVGLEALSIFLSALIQADRMGSGLGRTLRLQAEQIRIERFQRAEKLALEAPVKMLFPLVAFIFPTIWIILGAPLIFNWIFNGGGM